MLLTTIKKKYIAFLFIVYTRYLMGSAYIFASIIKIKGKRFTTNSGENAPFDSASHLFETLYQSGMYWKFIGIAQLLAGILLITQRYAKLGAVICLPISINIFLITISYSFGYTPVVTGLFLLANLLLIFWDWSQLKVLLNYAPLPNEGMKFENYRVFEITGLTMAIYTITYRFFVDKYDALQWMIICFIIGLTGFLYTLFKKKQ